MLRFVLAIYKLLTDCYCENWPLRTNQLVWFLGGPSWGPLCCTPHHGEASPSSLSRKAAMLLSSHCRLRFLSPVRGSLSWAALLSPPSFCEEVLQGRLTKLKESVMLLHEMGALLRSCFALPTSFAPVLPPTPAKPV